MIRITISASSLSVRSKPLTGFERYMSWLIVSYDASLDTNLDL